MSKESQLENCQGLEAETSRSVLFDKILNICFFLLVILPCAYLFYLSFKNSLSWRFSMDLPPLLYTGFLIDRFSYIPYRDFFDMNMVGAHISYMFIIKIFGYSDIGIRWADLTYILTIMGATLLLTRNMGVRVMLLAPFLFIFYYLQTGSVMTLQREIVALPYVALGTAASVSFPKIPLYARAVLAGFLFGVAATIKPHLVIGLPVVVLYLASEDNLSGGAGWGRWCGYVVFCAFFAACGLVIPICAVIVFLLYHGAMDEWFEILSNYLPLYSFITNTMSVSAPGQRGAYLLDMIFKMKHVYPLFPAGAIGLVYGIGNPAYSPIVRKQVALLMGLGIVYWVYPMISGQFWSYHYFPFSFFMCCGMALAVGPWSTQTLLLQRLFPIGVAMLVFVQLFKPYDGFRPLFQPPNAAGPNQIAAYLREHLNPGDKVQPLDTAAGVVQGMLLADAEIATPFIYNFHFYHHVSNPYIIELRRRFVQELNESPPRFIIQGKVRKRLMTGYDTSGNFPALDNFIKQHYKPVKEHRNYFIWEYNAQADFGDRKTQEEK